MKPGGSLSHSQELSNKSLSWAESTQILVLIPIYLIFVLILSSHLHLGIGVPVKILNALLPSSILATWTTHFNLLDLITLTVLGESYKLWSSSLWNLLHSPFLSLLGPNIYLRISFSHTFNLCSFFKGRERVSHCTMQ